MSNIFKAFMYDLRTDGFVYAVKSTVRGFNPYAQLRDAREWVEDLNGVVEALSDDVLQLERDCAALRAEKEEADLSVPAGKYEPREATTLMLDEWLDPDTRKQAIQAAKLLHPLLETKRPRKKPTR